MEASQGSPWGVTLCFKDPQLEADFALDHAARHRREDAIGSFILTAALYVMIVLTKTGMTDQSWTMPMDELRPMSMFATVEKVLRAGCGTPLLEQSMELCRCWPQTTAINRPSSQSAPPSHPCMQALPGLLAVLLPSQTYLRLRTRIHQASLLATAAVLPFHGYRRSADLVSGEENRMQAAMRAASRIAATSGFTIMVFELLGRQLLLRHRLPCLLPWTWMALQRNMDHCRVRAFTTDSGVAIHDAHVVAIRAANIGLGEWPLGSPRLPTQGCAVLTTWCFLVMGLTLPNIFLYTMEVRERTRYLVERGLPPPRLKLSKGLEENFLLLPSVLGGMWLLANALAAVPPNKLSSLFARWNAYLMQTGVPEITW
ncbi:hypothetical protein ACKKBG_A07900 [Auxenochlorella protothecoides x Auxenochlorella symbiontica]